QPKWVKKALEENQSMEISPDAPAVVLFIKTVLQVSREGVARENVQYALKVLKPRGTDFADLEITTTPTRKVKDVQGWHIDRSGTCRQLDAKNIREINRSQTAGFYDEDLILIAAFPDVTSGEAVAYEYGIDIDDSLKDNYYPFTLQYGLPVLKTYLEVEIPDGWQIQISENNLSPLTFRKQDNNYFWEGHNLPYRADEPYMPDWPAGALRLAVNCYSFRKVTDFKNPAWPACSKWTWEIFEEPSDPTPELADLAAQLTESAVTLRNKIDIITAYVRDKIRYVAVEIGEGRFKPRPADVTYHNLYGDCKDKVTLARAMLKALDIPSYPALVQTQYPVDTGLPTPFQFNHCLLAVPLSDFEHPDEIAARSAPGNDYIFIDPTYEYAPTGYLYPPVYGSRALVASNYGEPLVRLSTLPPRNNRRRYCATARLNADKSFTADIDIRVYGLQAVNDRRHLAKLNTDDLNDEYRRWLAQTCNSPRLENFAIKDFDDSILVTFKLSADGYLGASGDYLLLKADFFHADRSSQLKKGERQWPIYFGPPVRSETEIEWRLDEALTHEEKNDSGRYACSLGEVTWEKTVSDSTITFKTKNVFTGETVSVDDYDRAREFEKMLKNCCNRKFMLTSK
ncbi:MAG: DUF3857 domain-containing protein, partial [candidate division Zixibacteria bacterium]|nr:DUF3857 domain-containing protein [candidate division Zixibacteria bacterium]